MLHKTNCLPHVILGVFLVTYVLFSVLTLGLSPLPAGDEAFYAQVMETHARTGRIAHERLLGVVGMDQEYPLFGKLYIILGSVALRTGLPELWGLRLLSFLALAVCLVFTFFWLKSMYDSKTGLLSIVLMLFSTPIFISSHTVRPECLDLALLSAALYYAHRSILSSGKTSALASGLATGALLTVHLGSAPLILVVGTWWILEYRLNFLRKAQFWVWVLGVSAGVSFWLYWHVLQNTDLYLQQLSVMRRMSPSPPSISRNPLYWFYLELDAIWKPYGFSRFGLGIIALSILAFGLTQALRRRDARDLKVAGATLSLFVFQSVLASNRYGWYVVFYLFFLCPILARLVVTEVTGPGGPKGILRRVPVSAVVLYVAVAAIQIGCKVGLDSTAPSLDEIGRRVSAAIPKDARVCASAPVYFTKPAFEWVDTWLLQILPAAGYPEQDRLGHNIEETLERAGIKYIVAHTDHDWDLSGLGPLAPSAPGASQPFDQAYFAHHHTEVVGVVDGGRGGKYVIRRVTYSLDDKNEANRKGMISNSCWRSLSSFP